MMSYMDSDYAARYASSLGLKVCANCYDLVELIPDNYLTGFHFYFSTFLVDEIRSIANDVFVSKVFNGDIASGTVRLLNFGDACSDGTEDICKVLYEHIKAGRAEMFSGEIKNTEGKIMVEKGASLKFDNILQINWLVQSVRKTGQFYDVIQEPVGSDFVIKK